MLTINRQTSSAAITDNPGETEGDRFIACVASVSVGFQSRERSKNEILIILPREKWERKNGAWGEGERNERNACQQRSVFCKTPPSNFCRDLSTCRASMTTTS